MRAEQNLSGGILIVEDHVSTANVLQKFIACNLPEIEIETAQSAEAALDLCRNRPPRLVILDINLPGIGGLEAIALFKAIDHNIRVVMHTSNDALVFREKSLAAGADGFVSKTSTFSELVPAIVSWLRPAVVPR